MNVASLLSRAGRILPGHPAVYEGTRLVSAYGALARRVAGMAAGLRQRHGLQPGDRVAVVMKNCPAYVETLFACWHAGIVCVPVNAKLHAREIAFILSHSGARVVMTSRDLAETVGAAATHDAIGAAIVVAGTPDYERLAASEPMPLWAAEAHEAAWLFYTSGTTGRPKGAILTHRNLMTMTLGYLTEVDPTTPADCILHPAPMSHGSGMYMLPHVAAMAAQVVPESGGFEPDEIAELLRVHRGASFFAAPTMVTRLLAVDVVGEQELAGLRTMIYGGGPMYVEDSRRALAAFGPRLAQIYGQGESPMTITVLPKHLHLDDGSGKTEARLASVGYAQATIELRVGGPDDAPLRPGEVGEVMVRGDAVMAGYWRNDEATTAAMRGDWLHTGDVGALDPDGFLTLKDRSKDVIISGGTNIYPREVEEVLLLHDSVAEVAVVGRRHPDWGEEVVAVIAPVAGRAIVPDELDALCLEHVARFKRPKHYLVLKELPKNNYGKILKTELRAIVDSSAPAA